MINAFKQIRLTNSLMSGITGRLYMGNNEVMYLSDTGSLASISYVGGVSGALATQIASSSAGVSTLNSLSGQINIGGAEGNLISISGQTIFISGNNQFATSGNLQSTGILLYNDIIGLSGQFNQTGSNLYSYINTFSGNQQSFYSGINPTGFDTYGVNYPLGPFTSTPRVFLTVEVSGNTLYNVNVSGRTPTGFSALFSDTVQESGVVLHVFATINN